MDRKSTPTKEELAISQWLKQGFLQKGKVKSHLADECCVTRQAVGDWVKFGKVDKKHLTKISRYLDLPIPSAATGGKDETVSEPSAQYNTHMHPDVALIIESLASGDMGNPVFKAMVSSIGNIIAMASEIERQTKK